MQKNVHVFYVKIQGMHIAHTNIEVARNFVIGLIILPLTRRSIPDFYSEMQKLVYNQPTAFDTERVVEEIKKLDLDGVSMVEDGKYKLVRRNEVISLIQTNGVCNGRQKSCKYCYKKDCPLSTEKTLSDKWSDIVKKGGVE